MNTTFAESVSTKSSNQFNFLCKHADMVTAHPSQCLEEPLQWPGF